MLEDDEWEKASADEKLNDLRKTMKNMFASVTLLTGQGEAISEDVDNLKELTGTMMKVVAILTKQIEANKSASLLQRLFRG